MAGAGDRFSGRAGIDLDQSQRCKILAPEGMADSRWPITLVRHARISRSEGVSRTGHVSRSRGTNRPFYHLYCASEGLACLFRGSLDTERLARTLGLDETQFITISQTVGYQKAWLRSRAATGWLSMGNQLGSATVNVRPGRTCSAAT
jgi:hypothetical protein